MESLSLNDKNDKDESITARFHKLEKACIEYDNGIDNEDKHYIKTLEELRKLI